MTTDVTTSIHLPTHPCKSTVQQKLPLISVVLSQFISTTRSTLYLLSTFMPTIPWAFRYFSITIYQFKSYFCNRGRTKHKPNLCEWISHPLYWSMRRHEKLTRLVTLIMSAHKHPISFAGQGTREHLTATLRESRKTFVGLFKLSTTCVKLFIFRLGSVATRLVPR